MKRERIFFIFALSGLTGLIYESVWAHYLKLFLGHAAYAQTLVLAIFMGGMALGSWLSSRFSTRWSNLLLGYALAEGLIGLFALFFHPLFVATTNHAYTAILPALNSPAAVSAFKWGLSMFLILPQSVLLGMTFPLMSGAFLRLFPERAGSSVAMLYFANSIGAFGGVLLSGFLLIRLMGLPGTIRLAGSINIALAAIVWTLAKASAPTMPLLAQQPAETCGIGRRYGLYLLAALVTGAASFIYEIGWIRMLSLVLGSSTHAFELMLSAFILGLACGGLWIKRRIDTLANPVRFLALVQIVMGVLAFATLLLYNGTFGVMQWLIRTLPKTDAGYFLFNLASHSIASAIMLPATFCAGMTLPLITRILLGEGHGEKSIGAVYAVNTAGGIIGIFFAVHVGLPLFGLKGLITSGAGLDIALGLLLAWSAAGFSGWRFPARTAWAGVAVVVCALLFVRLDPYKMASGVYRDGQLLKVGAHRLLFHRDGKTATVSVLVENGNMAIRTNGKSESIIALMPDGRPTIDEPTTILLGALPLMFHPEARRVANIGLGTGLTTHTLLSSPGIEEVDTIEIERAIVEGASYFTNRSGLVFRDPRSRIHIDDAKTFFPRHGKRYDIIVSEPSNPWVSGEAGLFTEEFYRLVSRHLEDDGIFVQWLQLYEIDLDLVASVLKAVSGNFSDYALFGTIDTDLLIVAKRHGTIGKPSPEVWKTPALRTALERVGINSLQDISAREVGTKDFLDAFLATFPVKANSDYYPVLDQNAANARFRKADALDLLRLAADPVPLFRFLKADEEPWGVTRVTTTPYYKKTQLIANALALRNFLLHGSFPDAVGGSDDILTLEDRSDAENLRMMLQNCRYVPEESRKGNLFVAAAKMVAYLTPGELAPVWSAILTSPCGASLTPLEQAHLSFFRALSRRDPRDTAFYARHLLESDPHLSQGSMEYLVAAGMLGSLAQEDRKSALRLWQQYRREIFGRDEPDIVFRFLKAQCQGG